MKFRADFHDQLRDIMLLPGTRNPLPEGKHIRPWIAQTLASLRSTLDADRLAALDKAHESGDVEQYLWKVCRAVVAHVLKKHLSDADIVEE